MVVHLVARRLPVIILFAINISVAWKTTEFGVEWLRAAWTSQTCSVPRSIGRQQVESATRNREPKFSHKFPIGFRSAIIGRMCNGTNRSLIDAPQPPQLCSATDELSVCTNSFSILFVTLSRRRLSHSKWGETHATSGPERLNRRMFVAWKDGHVTAASIVPIRQSKTCSPLGQILKWEERAESVCARCGRQWKTITIIRNNDVDVRANARAYSSRHG